MNELPLRAELVGAEPYGAPVADVPVRLNVNENPYPPPPGSVAAMAKAAAAALGDVNRYPDREAQALRTALAGYVGVDPNQVWPANGSNEVMHQILGAFGGPGHTMASFTPTYSMYPVYARDTNTDYVTCPRQDDATIDLGAALPFLARHRPEVVCLASPNNPTGTLLPLAQIAALHAAIQPFGVLVVDEAYLEFAPDAPSAVSLLDEAPRLIVTRTLSKAWGLAGLRLGYANAAPEIVDALRIVRLPYHLSAVTQAVAVAAVQHADELLAPVCEVVTEREKLLGWLGDRQIPCLPSAANFVLIGPLADAEAVFRHMWDEGVLVRRSGPDHLRLSIGTLDENRALRRAVANAVTATSATWEGRT